MRAMKIIYVVLGVVMTVAGAAGAVWALGSDSVAGLGVGIAAGSVAFVGIVFLFVARYFGGLDDSAVLASGIPGTGPVVSVRDTGVTVNNLNAVIKAHVLVSIPTRPAYEADMRVLLRGRASWGTIQPGMTIPVKVDPSDHTKVVLDRERPVMPTITGGLGGLRATARGAGGAVPDAGGVPVVTISTADIIAAGVATDGRLLSVEPTGLTARARRRRPSAGAGRRPDRQGRAHVRRTGRRRGVQRVVDAGAGRQGRIPGVGCPRTGPLPSGRAVDRHHRLGPAVGLNRSRRGR